MSTVTKDFRKVKILSNSELCSGYFILSIETSETLSVNPGQFLQLRLIDKGQFLRRPFGVFDQRDNYVEILYKVRGDITYKMSLLKTGDKLDIICPLGNGFKEPSRGKPIIVSGGTGFAPLSFLAKRLSSRAKDKGIFIIGSAGAESEKFAESMSSLNIDYLVVSEDGSVGKRGVVTDYLADIIEPDSVLFSAGPIEMLKNIYRIAKDRDIETQFSFESHFACGMGFCWGCALKTRNGTLRVCKEGPVFKGEDILWEDL
ncbi:MAG: dihydroorotate dehydrogenase electron transfer subunit [Candidatus Kaelpia aquatica]|nr:dihydroorotate dehydrogenase electron transfer subunit [Candidatus Kaelpia aquatica]